LSCASAVSSESVNETTIAPAASTALFALAALKILQRVSSTVRAFAPFCAARGMAPSAK
jgi:hypothetical protein